MRSEFKSGQNKRKLFVCSNADFNVNMMARENFSGIGDPLHGMQSFVILVGTVCAYHKIWNQEYSHHTNRIHVLHD